MISLIKSGIVCLVSIFYLKYDSLAKLDVIETTYLFKPINAKISTERKQCVVAHMFINKTKCNRKICITYSKQLVQTCISTEKKVCLVHFYMVTCCEQENKSQLYVFAKVQQWFCPETCTHCRQIIEFRECCNWMYIPYFLNQQPGKLVIYQLLKDGCMFQTNMISGSHKFYLTPLPTKAVTYGKTAKNEKRHPTNNQSSSQKVTAFLSGISLHFRPFIICYGFRLDR